MAEYFAVADINKVLLEKALPSITQFNRLEGRPRSTEFSRSLKAEVRDALWMLSRQWQMGEFRGDDAGAPVLAQMRVDYTRLTKAQLGDDAPHPMDDPLPLEARVERLPAPLEQGGRKIGFDLRLMLGRQWLKLAAEVGDYAQAFRDAYPIARPDPDLAEDADISAHADSFAMMRALAGRAMDGGALYLHLTKNPGARATDNVLGIDPGHVTAINERAQRLIEWYARFLAQPDGAGAWRGDRLEYRFRCSAPTAQGAKVYTAPEHGAGRLDWWALDAEQDGAPLAGADDPSVIGAEVRTMIPSALSFDGMPNARYWAFEDHRVNFGAVSAATTDLAKLFLLDFALVYSNDWYIAPFTAPAGTVATLTGCAVTNTFGERIWIEPAAHGVDDDPGRFALFNTSVEGKAMVPADRSLLLLPVAPQVIDGPAIEDVLLLRDEMANMVWGVEKTVSLPDGSTRPGLEAARETRRRHEAILKSQGATASAAPAPAADVRYTLMQAPPENWIPFVAARAPGSDRAVRLQRAALPRVIEGDPDTPKRVTPRTWLLRSGLDASPKAPYFLYEEEVSRAGANVVRRYERCRWRDGRVVVWLSARKMLGFGEGLANLAFDWLKHTPRDAP